MVLIKNKFILGIVLLVAVIGLGLYFWQSRYVVPAQSSSDAVAIEQATNALRAVVNSANDTSGITSGAVFNFEVVSTNGKFANFGVVRYQDEVRADSVVEEHAVTFREVGGSGNAEVDRATHDVVSLHRSMPGFLGGEYSAQEIETRARQFLAKVYPEFQNIESSLDFDPGMKGTRLNNGNYFFRWNDNKYTVPKGLSMDIAPFIQVGITASGFIFSYENTFQLYRNLTMDDFQTQ